MSESVIRIRVRWPCPSQGPIPFLECLHWEGWREEQHTHTRARAQRLRAESPDVDIQLAHDGLHVPLRL